MKIKICGLSRQEDIAAVNEARPDYVGFVFAPSRRQVDPDRAKRLKKALNPGILAVGVFVNALAEEILPLCRAGVIDLIQLHGEENAAYITALKARTHAPVIRAVRVRSKAQVLRAQEIPCDYLLLDAYRKGMPGGTGEGFDWSLLPPLSKPFFLAGGIRLETVKTAASVCPYCLDVSSGAETGGRKDPNKIKALVRAVREESK
ncbi:MAG: phosphoribosylanthranilate isomerase [Oscillospiraceae bacterium]|nr:phosphoribosylanthranilate isomerase [Oscillospiraceae bacterium]